jgi:hypothetical protein
VVPAYRAADDRGRETETIVRGFALLHPAILAGTAFNLTKPGYGCGATACASRKPIR